MSIVVTCASGRLGRRVAEALIGRAGGHRVIAADAEPERLDRALRDAAETRQADFADPLTLTAAFAGAVSVLLPAGEGGPDIGQTAAAIDAARAAGVERIVLLSSIDPRPGNPAAWAGTDRATEGLVRASGVGWTILRLQEALEDFVAIGREQQPTGRMFTNRAAGASAPIALADAAAAIAAALADASHAGRVHDLTGPELVTSADLAAALGIEDFIHKDGKYLNQLIGDGRSVAEAEIEVALGRAVREGYYAVASGAAQALVGRPVQGLKAMIGAEPASP